MTGTYGRILANLQGSSVLAGQVRYLPLRLTLPSDGGPGRRLVTDLRRGLSTIAPGADVFHIILQKYRALYREFPLVRLAQARGLRAVIDIRAGTLQLMLQRRGSPIQNALMRSLLRIADAIVVECRSDVHFISARFARDACYLPNAALNGDFERLTPAPPPCPGEPLRVIYSGRYSAAKGVATLLDGVALLADRGVRVELHLTGQGTEPELDQKIRRACATATDHMRVLDHGWCVDDLFALLSTAHVFVLPTAWVGEGHPNAVTEAMMSGLALVLSDWAHRASIVPEEGALIVPPGEPRAVADALARYALDPDRLARARASNRLHVRSHYLDTVCYPALLDLYRRLAPGPQRSAT